MEGATSVSLRLAQNPQNYFGFNSEGVTTVSSNILDQTCFLLIEVFGQDRDHVIEVIQQSAELGHSILSKKRFYNEAHGKLLERLFNVISRQVYKISKGVSVGSLTIFDISKRSWWAGRVGDGRCYLYRQNQIVRLVPVDESVNNIQFLGENAEPITLLTRGNMQAGDVFVITCKSLMSVVNEHKLQQILHTSMRGGEPEKTTVNNLLTEALERRKLDSYGVWVIRT